MKISLLCLLSTMLAFTSNSFADIVITKLQDGTTEQINKHGICKDVTNASGNPLMVPTQTSLEWSNFLAATIPGVSFADCDICPGITAIGASCPNGAIYAGTYNYGGGIGTKKLLMTVGGCDNANPPNCFGGGDTVSKVWSATPTSAGTNSSDGLDNTLKILTLDAASPAAKYCADMTYATISDWYLPALDEMTHIYTNRAALGTAALQADNYYWTSTENGGAAARTKYFTGGTNGSYGKANIYKVRCLFRY